MTTAVNATLTTLTTLTRLHDVMASRSNAQAKLNAAVDAIGVGMFDLCDTSSLTLAYINPRLAGQPGAVVEA